MSFPPDSMSFPPPSAPTLCSNRESIIDRTAGAAASTGGVAATVRSPVRRSQRASSGQPVSRSSEPTYNASALGAQKILPWGHQPLGLDLAHRALHRRQRRTAVYFTLCYYGCFGLGVQRLIRLRLMLQRPLPLHERRVLAPPGGGCRYWWALVRQALTSRPVAERLAGARAPRPWVLLPQSRRLAAEQRSRQQGRHSRGWPPLEGTWPTVCGPRPRPSATSPASPARDDASTARAQQPQGGHIDISAPVRA